MRFVTRRGNELSMKIVRELERRGCQTLLLWNDREAPAGTMALFDLSPGADDKGRCRTNLRLAAHRLLRDAPDWARKAVYLVGVRKLPGNPEQFNESVSRLIRLSTVDPTAMNLLVEAPWGAVPKDQDNMKLYLTWMQDCVGEREEMPLVQKAT